MCLVLEILLMNVESYINELFNRKTRYAQSNSVDVCLDRRGTVAYART
jgi:hypothetical protein